MSRQLTVAALTMLTAGCWQMTLEHTASAASPTGLTIRQAQCPPYGSILKQQPDSREWIEELLPEGYVPKFGEDLPTIRFRWTEVGRDESGWAVRQAIGGIPCNNSEFGDPAFGIVKACYIVP